MLAAAGDAERWVLLFGAVPPPPALAADALAQIRLRIGAVDNLAIEVADPALRRLQYDIDALHAPEVAASAAVMEERLRAVESDPELARLGREIDRVMKLSAPNGTPPSVGEVLAVEREVTRTLAGPSPNSDGGDPRAAPAPPSAIIAYRSERQRSETSGARLYKRLFEAQSRYAGLHATRDREALARVVAAGSGTGPERATITGELIDAHHALAQQQLVEATALFIEARATLRSVVEHMAKLAQEATARGASAFELAAAYGFIKGHVELLLTIDRVAIEDAGFWIGVRTRAGVGPADALYEFAQAPGVELRVGSAMVVPGAPYPPGRARSNAAPGIH